MRLYINRNKFAEFNKILNTKGAGAALTFVETIAGVLVTLPEIVPARWLKPEEWVLSEDDVLSGLNDLADKRSDRPNVMNAVRAFANLGVRW